MEKGFKLDIVCIVVHFGSDSIINDFVNGVTVVQLSKKFSCTTLTIVRNLKKNLSESKYNSIFKKNKTSQINLSETKTTPNQLASNKGENNILINEDINLLENKF